MTLNKSRKADVRDVRFWCNIRFFEKLHSRVKSNNFFESTLKAFQNNGVTRRPLAQFLSHKFSNKINYLMDPSSFEKIH